MNKTKLLCVVGSRSEAIKMAPVIMALRNGNTFAICILATAPRRHLLGMAYDLRFGCDAPPNQTLPELTAKLMASIDSVLENFNPDMVIAQGDTTTAFTAALAAFYRKIPFSHVKAGLRSKDIYSPFPEEGNRILASHLTALHFAPTTLVQDNLIREGIEADKIVMTGNTVIETAERNVDPGFTLPEHCRMILVTSHRQENFDEPLKHICNALRNIIDKYDDVCIVFPVHPNPHVRETVYGILAENERIKLINPLGYEQFVSAMKRAHLILMDSDGAQEEAPALGKPVLVLRQETERTEALAPGATRLVGTNPLKISHNALIVMKNTAML